MVQGSQLTGPGEGFSSRLRKHRERLPVIA